MPEVTAADKAITNNKNPNFPIVFNTPVPKAQSKAKASLGEYTRPVVKFNIEYIVAPIITDNTAIKEAVLAPKSYSLHI